MNNERDVIVFLETADERADRINSGLLAEAQRIAGCLGGEVALISSDSFDHPCNAVAGGLKAVLKNVPFRLLLFAGTDQGGILASQVALQYETAAVIDCRDIRFSDGILNFVRNVYGDQFEQELSFRSFPEIAALNPESLMARDGALPEPASVRRIRLELPEGKSGIRTIETIPPDFATVDLRYAKRIVDIGFGCSQPGLLEMARELADLLEASVGTTRPMVDDGYWPKSRMIGQTGKTTAPEICVTLGVSGSPHHTAGLQKSGTVLSVNSDPRAPVFDVSNSGFVSDLQAVLPKLIERIKRYREGS